MKIDAKFGNGEIEVINRKWMTTPVNSADCVSSRIKNGSWGYGMGMKGEDLSYLGEDFVESVSNDSNAHLFLNGIYCFVREGRKLFKNVSLVIEPSLGGLGSWRYGDVEIVVADGVVKDLDFSPEYGTDAVRDIMVNFGHAYCDMSTLKERYEDDCASRECTMPFDEWMTNIEDTDIMDPDQLEEAEYDGPHWWYGDFLYDEVREWIYEGVEKWRKEQLECFRLEKTS